MIFGGTADGSWSAINWSIADYFIRIYLGNSTGTDFTEMGTSQLLSVPYALHASTVDVNKLPATYDKFNVTGSIKVGENGLPIGEIIEITGTTDATNNSVSMDLPDGYLESSTRVLSVEIQDEVTGGISDYTVYYGLGFTGTNGSVSYKIGWYELAKLGSSHYRMILYYPDELKGKSFRALLLKRGLRLIPL